MPARYIYFVCLVLLHAILTATAQKPAVVRGDLPQDNLPRPVGTSILGRSSHVGACVAPSGFVRDATPGDSASNETSVRSECPLLISIVANGLSEKAELPDAPEPQLSGHESKKEIPASQDEARISGLVLDSTGASISGAEITISRTTEPQQLTTRSKGDGRFSFAMLPASSYVVTIRAEGFSTFISNVVSLTEKQNFELPGAVLAIASVNNQIIVRPTEQVAAEEIKAAERQRVFGLFPNFFTSYVYDASPLTAKQKLSLTAHDTFDPVSLFGVAAVAGIEQANRTFPGYGNDAPGFGKRFGAALGDTLTNDFLSHAIFPALLHEDPRYFYQGSGTKKQRLYHALSYAIVTRSDSGHLTPNLSYLLGDLGSGALSNLYYPHADRGAGLVFTQAAIGIGGQAAGAIVREFLSKRLTTNVPGNGKP